MNHRLAKAVAHYGVDLDAPDRDRLCPACLTHRNRIAGCEVEIARAEEMKEHADVGFCRKCHCAFPKSERHRFECAACSGRFLPRGYAADGLGDVEKLPRHHFQFDGRPVLASRKT